MAVACAPSVACLVSASLTPSTEASSPLPEDALAGLASGSDKESRDAPHLLAMAFDAALLGASALDSAAGSGATFSPSAEFTAASRWPRSSSITPADAVVAADADAIHRGGALCGWRDGTGGSRADDTEVPSTGGGWVSGNAPSSFGGEAGGDGTDGRSAGAAAGTLPPAAAPRPPRSPAARMGNLAETKLPTGAAALGCGAALRARSAASGCCAGGASASVSTGRDALIGLEFGGVSSGVRDGVSA